MYPHHEQSINNLIHYFKVKEGIVAIILGGSVAKGLERPDSDIDALVVVSDEKYWELEQKSALSECIFGHCTYEGGYFDIKYMTKGYLSAAADHGSEPSRNAFVCARVLWSADDEIFDIVEKIPVYQTAEKEEKLLSFYSALRLHSGYFWRMSKDNTYLRSRAGAEVVLYGLRMILAVNERLFPCHKALLSTVKSLSNKPENIIELTENLLSKLDDASKDMFVNTVLSFCAYEPPTDYSAVLTRFIDDNELWWYKGRPVITEW